MNKIYIRFLLFVFTTILFSQSEITDSRNNAITTAIKYASPAVAGISITKIRYGLLKPTKISPMNEWLNRFFIPQYRKKEVQIAGSGVVISPDGYILTNAHVVENNEKIIVTLQGGDEYNAEVVGLDNLTDIALLKLDGKNFPFIKISNSNDLIIGEWVIALGNPFGLFDVNQEPTATIGIISGKDLDFGLQEGKVFQGMIQTDAAINPGNSGGPLVNSKGELIGINSWIYTGSNSNQGSVGIGFAIPINRAILIAEELKTKGQIVRDFTTGIRAQPLDLNMATYLGLPINEGVIITSIASDSPAQKAKLEYGDIIVAVENVKVLSLNDILEIIEVNDIRPGDRVQLKIWRDGRYINRKLRLGKL